MAAPRPSARHGGCNGEGMARPRSPKICAALALALVVSGSACARREAPGHDGLGQPSPVAPTRADDAGSRTATPSNRGDAGPVRVETVPVPGDEPAFVLRGSRGSERMVFLHGMCGHGQGYVQSFQHAAAAYGTVIGLQGDVGCGNEFRTWSGDVAKLHARIGAALRAGGFSEEGERVAMGYSQGATRAESLAERYPDIYTRVVLIGAPTAAVPSRLRRVKSAVFMAGERDRQDLMRAGQRAAAAQKIESVYLTIPGATHGAMGGKEGDSERIMGEALRFLFGQQAPND